MAHLNGTPAARRLPAAALTALLLLSALFPLASCRSDEAEDKAADEAARLDSTVTALGNRIFSEPARCDSVLSALQRRTADSVVWHRIALYRASARIRMGDSAAAAPFFEGVRRFCTGATKSAERKRAAHLFGEYHNHLGVAASMANNATAAERHYLTAAQLLGTPPRTHALIPVMCNLGDIYALSGRLPLSAHHYHEALFLCDSLGEARERAAVLTGLSRVYIDMGNFREARACLAAAGKMMAGETRHMRFFYYNTLGNCLYLQQRYAEALSAFRAARAEATGLASPVGYVQTEINTGETLLMMDSVAAAARHIGFCRRWAEAHPGVLDAQSLFYINFLAADLAIARGDRAASRRILGDSVPSGRNSSPRYLMLHYRRLQRYAERGGEWETAYRMQREAARYADTLRSIQNINAVAEMELRYRRDSTLSRQRIALVESEARAARKNVYIVGAVAAAVVIAAVGVALLLVYRQRTQRKLRRQMEKMTELRMDIVRNRVSPHYVFNVLNTVFPKLRNNTEVAFPLELLIDVLRGNLLSSSKVETTLSAELRLVRDFVRLHQCCRGGYPLVEWHVDEGLEESTLPIPAMVIEIPVENALKHAFPQLTAECRVDISVNRDADGALRVEVRDNGAGYNPGAVRPTGRDTGTGLRVISRTIAILNQYNRRHASFSIASLPAPQHGTAVTLVFPPGYSCELPAYGGVEP